MNTFIMFIGFIVAIIVGKIEEYFKKKELHEMADYTHMLNILYIFLYVTAILFMIV